MREVAAVRGDAGAGGALTPHRSVLAVRLAEFVAERFPLPAYGPLILALVACGWTAAAVASGRRPEMSPAAMWTTVAVALAFLQLRILDDIRDAGTDLQGRPGRPVPRGLVNSFELRAFAVVAAVAGVGVTLLLGALPCAVFGVTLGVIWGLGTDQPRRLPIRYGVMGEALVHSIIAPALLLFVWVSGAPVGGGAALASSLILAWGASLALEGSRKIVRSSEEHPGVATYSAAFGRPRALLLTALAIATACLGAAGFATAVGASTAWTAVPLMGALLVPLATQRFGAAASTLAIRSASTILVLCLLLWPVAVLLGKP